jgi:ubiquinone/menaquinone biosynthesis C-methylase UbiE
MKKHSARKPQPNPPQSAPKQTHWGPVAQWYDKLVGDEGSEYQREVVFPGVLKLLDVKKGQRILDVACGQGAFCRALAAQGALAIGVDAAKELIEQAKARTSAPESPAGEPPRFFVGDARQLGFLNPSEFDAITCILAIQNIDDLPAVFGGVARALKDHGRFVTIMMHPAFRGPKYSHWGWDDEQKAQYRRVDRYLLPRKEPIFTHPGKKTGQYTWSFHRPIQTYVRALRAAGLLIDAMEEWPSHKSSEAGPRAAAENTARKEIPMFLAIRAIKVTIDAKAPGGPAYDANT